MHHGHSHDGGKCAHSHGGGGGGFHNVGFGDEEDSKQKLMIRPPPLMMQTGDAGNSGSGMTPMMMMPPQMTPQMMEFAKKMHEQRQILMKEFMEQGGNSNPQAVQDLMTKASQIQAQAMAQFKAASLANNSNSSDQSSLSGQPVNSSSMDLLNNKTNSSSNNKTDSASNLLNANLNASKLDELINSNKNSQSGQPKKVKDQDEENKILDAISKKDYSSLNAIKATQYGVLDRLKELVESGECDPHKPDSENVYLLHWAAINNRLEIAKYLISLGCEVDQVGGELESTPLNWAARSGHVMMAILLIQNGANPKLFDIEGFSTIHLATMFAHSNVVAYLLVQGVDVIIKFIFKF
jgi:ankyrin repeat protein